MTGSLEGKPPPPDLTVDGDFLPDTRGDRSAKSCEGTNTGQLLLVFELQPVVPPKANHLNQWE